jgi:hypothetical protein
MRFTLASILGALVLASPTPLRAADPDKAAEAFGSLQKQLPATVKQFVKDSPWFVADQKTRTRNHESAEAVSNTTGEKVPPLGEQAEVKVVRRTAPGEARLKLLFRLSEGEAIVEIRAAYQDGAWTTTGFECNCEPGFMVKEKLEFQLRKLLLEIDAISSK